MNTEPNLLILFLENTTDDLGSRRVVRSNEYYGHLAGAVKQADLLANSVKSRELVWEILDRKTLQLQLKNF
jgi:hypothetical protein